MTTATKGKNGDKTKRAENGNYDAEEHSRLIQGLLQLKEPLLPELRRHIKHKGTFLAGIYHPLVMTSVFNDDHGAYANYLLRDGQNRLAKFRAEKNYAGAVLAYTQPYRLQGFMDEIKGADDKTYWKVLSLIWNTGEGAGSDHDLVLALFNSQRRHRESLMDEGERKTLKRLSDELTVYRGFFGRRAKSLSWTLDRNVALWFANRFKDVFNEPRYLIEGTASKKDVIAYFAGREESEVIIDPEKVKVHRKERIAA